MNAKRKSGGSKLARTEIVQVRLDPKLRLAAEFAAAKERRTLSSFVEWAVEQAVKEVQVTQRWQDGEGRPINADEAAERVWDVDEADRFVKLAQIFPELLTVEEQRLWKLIRETPYFCHSNHFPREFANALPPALSSPSGIGGFRGLGAALGTDLLPPSPEPDLVRIRAYWDTLKQVAAGELDRSALPQEG
jgi:hypothetical protein